VYFVQRVRCVCVCVCVVCCVCVCLCVCCVLCVCSCSLCRPEASHLHPAYNAGCGGSVCVVCCVCVLVHFADQKPVTCTQHATQAAGTVCALCVCVCVCVCVVCVVFFFLFTLPTRSQSPAPSIRRRLQGQRVLSECMRPYCDLLK